MKQMMAPSAPLTIDYADQELRRQAALHAKEKLDKLDLVTKDDMTFFLWLEQRINPVLDATDPTSLDKFNREMLGLLEGTGSNGASLETAPNEAKKYEGLTDREPLKEADVMPLLGASKAIVTYLIGEEESFVWAITAEGATWASIPITRAALEEKLSLLRCGLDGSKWRGDDAFAQKCIAALGLGHAPQEGEPPPFSFTIAHELYTLLLGPIEGALEGKQLIIVPSGGLVSLPFQVLMRSPPAKAVGTAFIDYAGIDWLGRSHVLSIVPSVPVVKLLAQVATKSRASDQYIGFGDPALIGDGTCPKSSNVEVQDFCASVGVQSGGTTRSKEGQSRAKDDLAQPRLGRRVPEQPGGVPRRVGGREKAVPATGDGG